jgi:hypothetical protein
MSEPWFRYAIIVDRLVEFDSTEPPEFREARAAFVSALAQRARRRRLERHPELRGPGPLPPLAPLPPPPDVPVWWRERYEAQRRRDDPELERALADLERRLAERDPRWVRKCGDETSYDFARAMDLLEVWTRVQDEGEARHIARMPPLAVKPGDFVDVGGQPMRVKSVNVLERTASLVLLDARGFAIAGDTGVPAEGLRPLPAPPTTHAPEPPASMTDPLERARFRKNALRAALARAGLDDD